MPGHVTAFRGFEAPNTCMTPQHSFTSPMARNGSMSDPPKDKSFPDVSAKLSALPKKSQFERQKAEAEAKRLREKAENAAALEDFVKSFDDEAGPPVDGRNTGKGAFKRHFTASTPRNSGPGTLGPPTRKRPHESFLRDQDGVDTPEETERAAAKPTLHLASLPPGTSPSAIKALIPVLTVDDVKILPQPGATTQKRSSSAIVILAGDTPAKDIDTAVSTLQNKYLGCGYYLNISRHLSSTAISSIMPVSIGLSSASSLPFGAKTVQPNVGARAQHGGFAPPTSYGPARSPNSVVEVKLPSDLKQLRMIHLTLENLLNHGPQFEALLMSRPEVQKDEKWAWLWDARTIGGVYYRWKLWQVTTNPRSEKAKTRQPTAIFEGGPTWMPPEKDLKFEYTTRLEEFVSDDGYSSSDGESSDGEDERRNRSIEGLGGHNDGHLNPLQKAKLTHLLARLPTTQANLRRGDIARLTAFAMEHVETGADEVVQMTVMNVLHPLAYTGANPDRQHQEAMEIEAKEKDKEEEKAKETKEGNDEKAKDQPAKRSFDPSASMLIGLFVISDIVNAAGTSGVRHSWRYPQLYDNALRAHNVFEHLGRLEKELGFGRISAGKWKQSLRNLLDHWEFLNCFVNLEHFKQVLEKPPTEPKPAPKPKETAAFAKSKSRWKTVDEESMSDVDGVLKGDSDFEEAVEEQTNTRQRKQRPKAEDMFPSDS